MTRQEITDNIILSIERDRVDMGLTQAEMAEKLEMSISGYKKMISGGCKKIDVYVLYKVAHLSNRFAFEFTGEAENDYSFCALLKDLTPNQLRFVAEMVSFEHAFRVYSGNKCDDYISVLTLTGDMYDGMIYDSTQVEKIEISEYRKKFGDIIDCGIRVTSNHLHPVYHAGDIILICCKPPRDGDIGVFIHKPTNRAYLRKFRQTNPCELIPVNGFGKTFYVDPNNETDMSQWLKFGYVISKIRTEV